MSNIVNEFNRLSVDGKSYFESSKESSFALAKERMVYLSSWIKHQSTMDRSTLLKTEQVNDSLVLFFIAFASLSLYVVYRKKMQ